MKVIDTSNVTEVMMFLMSMPAFYEYLEPAEAEGVEQSIGPTSKVCAHKTVKLAYESRKSIEEQVRQVKLVLPALCDDITKRAAEFLPGGKIAELSPEERKSLSAVPLNNDASERTFGIMTEEQRRKPNESLATSEAQMLAQTNDPFGYIDKRSETEKDEIWLRAREEQKNEKQRARIAMEEMQAKKREKMKKKIEDAKRREEKAANEKAEYDGVEPINTKEDLQEHLTAISEDAVRAAFLRDQIKNWHSKGVTHQQLPLGRGGARELKRRLSRFLAERVAAVVAPVVAKPVHEASVPASAAATSKSRKRKGVDKPAKQKQKKSKQSESAKSKRGTKRGRQESTRGKSGQSTKAGSSNKRRKQNRETRVNHA